MRPQPPTCVSGIFLLSRTTTTMMMTIFSSVGGRVGLLFLAWLVMATPSAAASNKFDLSAKSAPEDLVKSEGVSVNNGTITLTSENRTSGSAFVATPVYVRHFRLSATIHVSNVASVGGDLSLCFEPLQTREPARLQGTFGTTCSLGLSTFALSIRTGTQKHPEGTSGCLRVNCIQLQTGQNHYFQPLYFSRAGVSITNDQSLKVDVVYYNGLLQIAITDPERKVSATQSYRVDIPSALGSAVAHIGFSARTEGRGFLQQVKSFSFDSSSAVYSIIDLGIITGNDSCETTYFNVDTIVGTCLKRKPGPIPPGPPHPGDYTKTAFRWDIDGIVALAPLVPGKQASATSINRGGQIVGSGDYTDFGQLVETSHALFWDADQDGKISPPIDLGILGTLTNTPSDILLRSEARWVNDGGKVVGGSSLDAQTEHAFIWDKVTQKMVDLGPLSTNYPITIASKINNSDHPAVIGIAIAAPGSAKYTAFVWDQDNGMRDLQQLTGGKMGSAIDINDKGTVLGTSSQPSCSPCYTYIWNSGSIDVISVPGAAWFNPKGLNNLGEVVGDTRLNDGTETVVKWDAASGVVDLVKALDASGQGWSGFSVRAINDKGWIIGSGKYGGEEHGFIIKSANIAQVYVGTASFQTSGQSLWGPGSGTIQQDLPLTLKIPSTPFDLGGYFNPAGLGETGAVAKGTLAAEAGLDFAASLSLGSVNVNYPVLIKLQFPDKDTIFAGDHIPVTSVWSIDSSAALSTVPPGANATLDAIAKGGIQPHFHAKAVGNDVFDSNNDWNFDKRYRLFDLSVLLGSSSSIDFDLFNLQVLTGSLKLPRLDVVSAISSSTTGISGRGLNTFMSIRGNPTKLLSTLVSVPTSFGFQFPLPQGSIYANADLLQLTYGANLSLEENILFQSRPRVHFEFSDGRPPQEFDAGGTSFIDIPSAPADPVVRITPTVLLPNQLTNGLSLDIDRGGRFVPVELKLGASAYSYNLGSWDFQPWNIEFPHAKDQFGIFNGTFPISGFTSQKMDQFTVAGRLHAAPSLVSVDPPKGALFIINDNESPTQNFDEFQRFVSGNTKLIISGSNFLRTGTQAFFAYHGQRTTLLTIYKNSGTLVAYIPNRLMLLPGIGRLTVQTPNSVGESNSLDFAVEYQTPVLTKVVPNLWAGDPHLGDALLSVIGSNFIDRPDYFQPQDSMNPGRLLQPYWDRLFPKESITTVFPDFDFKAAAPLPTVYWNDQPVGLYQEPVPSGFRPSLLPSSYFDRSQIASVYLVNPGPGDVLQSSSQKVFIGAPQPVLKKLEPGSAQPGSPGFRLALKGSSQIPSDPHDLGKPAEGFEASSVVLWNGTERPTTFISATEIQADISASDLLTGFSNQVSVANPYVLSDGTTGRYQSSALSFVVSNPAPTIGGLLPLGAVSAAPSFQGDPKYNLAIQGAGFAPTSVVKWDGSPRVTRYVSNTQLEAALLANDVALPGQHNITVSSPPLGGGESNSISFLVTNPMPQIGKLVPSSVAAGGPGFTLDIQGQGFYSGSVATLNGSTRPAHFKSAGDIAVDLTAADIAQAGTAEIKITNPAPGGGVSAPSSLQIK